MLGPVASVANSMMVVVVADVVDALDDGNIVLEGSSRGSGNGVAAQYLKVEAESSAVVRIHIFGFHNGVGQLFETVIHFGDHGKVVVDAGLVVNDSHEEHVPVLGWRLAFDSLGHAVVHVKCEFEHLLASFSELGSNERAGECLVEPDGPGISARAEVIDIDLGVDSHSKTSQEQIRRGSLPGAVLAGSLLLHALSGSAAVFPVESEGRGSGINVSVVGDALHGDL
jgi:hypothetical protein